MAEGGGVEGGKPSSTQPTPVHQEDVNQPPSLPTSPTSPTSPSIPSKTQNSVRRQQESSSDGCWQLGAATAAAATTAATYTGTAAAATTAATYTGTATDAAAAAKYTGTAPAATAANPAQMETENLCLSPTLEPDNIETLYQTSPAHHHLHLHHTSAAGSAASPPGRPPPGGVRPLLSRPPDTASPTGGALQQQEEEHLSTRDPNWQSNKCCLRERNAAMFNNSLMADIQFLVGGGTTSDTLRRVPAHKYVLATGSTVFYAMLYGGLAHNTVEEIKVPDVDPDAFLSLLRYLYCDEIHLEPDNVLATLYAAKKYIVPHLARECVKYLETSLSARNACLLLSQSRLFEEPELMQRCWDVIDAQAEIALKSDGFIDIDLHTLETILSRETLNCKEIVVFEAASAWAAAEAVRRGVEDSPEARREILGPAMNLIRFPAMNVEEFADSAAQSGMLSLQETTHIFLNFTAKLKPPLEYPVKPRIGMKKQICHRFQSSAYRSNQWRYRGRCDSIQFCVDKRIFIVGFGLYGSSNGSADYSVRIELKHGGRVLATNTQKFFSDGSSNTFHVFFHQPVQIEADKSYTASAVLDGAELSYFGQEGLSEVMVKRVSFQFQCSSESTNGTGVQGGQIPEIIFYGPKEQ